jgi:anti-sigma regulatory factor (Ser/Thr protein kinase)
MEDLSLHILDIVENSITAAATEIRIRIDEDTRNDRLVLEIHDDGTGMDKEMQMRALDPFFTTRTTRRVGLGLPLLAQAARESGGQFEVTSSPGNGTTVRAVFQLNHPDRKPMGDIPGTLGTILAGRPRLDLVFEYTRDEVVIDTLDTRSCRRDEPESAG